MSHWTHITACFSVETGILEPEAELLKQVKEYLKKAPEITGSEGPADIFVNIQSGHNYYMSYDCNHCEYKDTLRDIKINGLDYTECDGPDDHDCSAKYQSCVVISIQGDLRDRTEKETKKEFDKFVKHLKKKYCIRDYAVNIESE